MQTLFHLLAQVHHHGDGWMWFGHWGAWIFWIVILLAVGFLIGRLSRRGDGK